MSLKLNSLFQALVPKDKKFFPLFDEMTSNLVSIAENLNKLVNSPVTERERIFITIDDLEQKQEDIARKTQLQLSTSFITPFDREDVFELTNSLYNVAGSIRGASSKMRLYQVEKMTKPIIKITEMNLEACVLIQIAVKESKNLKNIKAITTACQRIQKLEDKSDSIYEKAVLDLFENETDAKKIMKYKEVLASLEKAADKCKDVSNVLEAISIKYA